MSRTIRQTAIAVVVLGLASSATVDAQGRGRSATGIPPGHLPPPGECRVWYDGVPPGQQPPPTSCRNAERVAGRDRNARVIYGGDRGRYADGRTRDDRGRDDDRDRDRRDDGRRDRYDPRDGSEPRERYDPRDRDGRTDRGRAVPRTGRDRAGNPYPEQRYPNGSNRRVDQAAVQNGYRDGVVKGREDIRDGDNFDPNRHAWYRSADRGYNSRNGSREEYRAGYRDGFLRGYDEAYNGRSTGGVTNGGRRPRIGIIR